MKVFLWILQIVIALLCLAGGSYKLFSFDELAKMPQTAVLPRAGWGALGVFEIICGILLIIPSATKWMPALTPVAAAALAVECLILAAVYARFSLKLAATNPLVWVAGIAVMAIFVAYGRFALRPLA